MTRLHTHYTQETIMTPYELRFSIFKQAQELADNEYHTAWATVEMINQNLPENMKQEFPAYPTYEYIEALAEKINKFVSGK